MLASELTCPSCGGELRYYDKVRRIVRTKRGKANYIKVWRTVCKHCHTVRRVLPDNLLPYKHYEKKIIFGVIDGTITSEQLDYEDYPCEMTMKRWRTIKTQNLQLL